jgi:hypothetical protein
MVRPTVLLLASGAWAAVAAPSASAQDVQLAAPVAYTTDYGPDDIAAADLDGDGILDLAMANQGISIIDVKGSVSVLLGTGGGAFASATTYDVGVFPSAIAAGDLDGDGLPELVVADHAGPLLVLSGTGAGRFGSATPHALAGLASDVQLGDLDGDGDLDVAATVTSKGISVLLNPGDGVLGPWVNYPAGVEPRSTVLRDIDADGTLDVVVASTKVDVVSVLLGQGGGVLGAPSGHPGGLSPSSAGDLAVGDLDGDGEQDVLLVNGAFVSVLLATGSGGFGAPLLFLSGASGHGLALADFDGDGLLDVCVKRDAGFVSILRGLGGGALGPWVAFPAGQRPEAVIAADFNGDGAPDVAVANADPFVPFEQGGVSILLNESGPEEPWIDLGSGLAGASGLPAFAGEGTLEPGTPGSLSLSNATPSSPALLLASLASTPTPFKGGTLLAVPIVLAVGLGTDGAGALLLPFTWPSGVPAATSLYMQCAIQDPTAPQGIALSNALQAITP